MRTILLALLLLSATVTLVAATPTSGACVPPNCPGFGGCHLTKPDYSIDPDSLTVTIVPAHMECYY